MANPVNRALYGVWIDQAVASNDPNQMKEALQAARKQYGSGGIHPLYAVWIDDAMTRGADREELQQLLAQAKAVQGSNLAAAIQKLEAYLAGKK
jgi:hypothetical protein